MRKVTGWKRTKAAGAAIVLACTAALASASLVIAGCSPAITNGSSGSEAAADGAPSNTGLATLELVHSDDALLSFAANSATAVLNGPDADGSNGDPESFAEKNLCFSPVSLYLACTLLGEGTQGVAQDQLLRLMGVEDADALKASAEEVRAQLEQTYGDAIVKVADSIWAGKGYEFTDSFQRDAEALGAGAFDVEFGTDEADRQISSWISVQTEGLLKPKISTELGQAAMLINTIYFKDAWASQFDQANNEVGPFSAPANSVQVNYLRQEIADSAYVAADRYTAARLSFSGGSTMTFVRPNDGVILHELFGSSQEVQDLLGVEMEPATVDWWIPKFSTDSSMPHLAESLKALGVKNVFSPEEADAFAPMMATDGGKGFAVGEVRQDTHLALDENGVEAAAYTSIGIMKTALMPETDPVEFKLDRSFLYYMTSPDGVVLFVGTMYNPALD